MEFPADWLTAETQHAFRDTYLDKKAPLVFIGSVLALTDGTLPPHLIVKASMAEADTRWSAAWANDAAVGHATATADVPLWTSHRDAQSGVTEPTTATSWVRPIDAITQVALTDHHVAQHRGLSERTHEWSWHAGAEIRFASGEPLLLPLHGPMNTVEEDRRTAALIAHLAAHPRRPTTVRAP